VIGKLTKAAAHPGGKSAWRRGTSAVPQAGRAERLLFEVLEPRLVLDAGPLVISEFLAINDSGLQDADGAFSDWIEIHNPTDARVELDGWSLTDEEDDPTKWEFPGGFIEPGEYLVVFASGKDRTDPAELHTNFSLAGSGEYLALTRNDGADVAHAFTPEYPRQNADVSYGVTPGAATLMLEGAGITYTVPTAGDAPLATTWTEPVFDDSSWDTSSLPPQVLITEAGTARDFVEIQNLSGKEVDTTGWVVVINDAESGRINDVHAIQWELPDTLHVDELRYRTDDADDANYWGENIFWKTLGSGWAMIVDADGKVVDFLIWGYDSDDTADFLVHVNGADITTDGIWEGASVMGTGGRDFSIQRNGLADHDDASDWAYSDPITTSSRNLGLAVPFSRRGTPGIGFETNSPELGEAISIDVQEAMYGRNSSLWTRIPFDVGNVSGLDEMFLRVRYNDGFVAYINGQEVAGRNAPAWPQWNSAALSDREVSQSLQFDQIDVSQWLEVLQEGTNVLAVQGLNFAAGDDEFLIQMELSVTAARYFELPTPGAINGVSFRGYVSDTKFSVDRGFYEEPFEVEITTDVPGAEIHYTVDGTWPSETHGTVYNGPIPIDTTTTLRAAAFREDYESTNIDTQTYIFLDDVIRQTGQGMPTSWGSAPNTNYAMDPDVVNDPRYSGTIKDDLRSIPSLSLVLDPVDLWDNQTGIYSNTGQHGVAWERPASVELIDGDGETLFQVNAGARIQGGASRNAGNLKHSFRLLFKGIYGPTKLKYPLFGEEATDRFDTVTLRAGFNDRWSNSNATYIQDRWTAQTQNDMGGYGPHGTFIHLYVNGLYWGLYNPVERPNASFAASYLGGDKEDYDAIVTRKLIDGNNTAWTELQSLVAQSPIDYAAVEQLLDIPNFIDYMIINQYGGNWDWPHNNWYATHSRAPGGKWQFHSWDAEGCLRDLTRNKVENDRSWNNGPGEFYLALRQVSEFRELYADHVHRHFFNGGLLTPEANIERLDKLVAPIDRAIVGESARWGDGYQDNGTARTRDDNWLPRLDWMRYTFFQDRGPIVIQQFQDAGLYPNVLAPAFNQFGGPVDSGFELTMHVTTGVELYEDTVVLPQFSNGAYLVPTDNSLGVTWTDWGFDDSTWVPGTTGIGYENGNGYQDEIRTEVRPHDVVDGAKSMYVRIPFTIDDLDDVDRLLLRMKYDDGFIAYINGQEVKRTGGISGSPPNYSTSGHEANEFADFDISAHIDKLVEGGQNVLAIHGINTGTGSSDMLVLPELVVGSLLPDPTGPIIYYTANGVDPRSAGGGLSGSAVQYNDDTPISLTNSGTIKARTYMSGQWSALNEAEFFVGTMAGIDNLAITEINYNPHDPTAEELAIDPTFESNDFEFIELFNTSYEPILFSLMEFTDGVTFDFTAGDVTELGPRARVVVTNNTAAFEARYGTSADVAGEYEGNLDNDGERLTLLDWQGEPLFSFAYNDAGDWPGRADGGGATLELIDTATVPAADPERTDFLEDGDNWRSSGRYGGSPGWMGGGRIGNVVINEVLSHTDPPLTDSIELYNTTGGTIDLSGWYLSDSGDQYKRFRIPDGTIIGSGQYVLFDEGDFNSGKESDVPFALDGAHGDDVWLMEADDDGKLKRFVDHVEFGAAVNGESFGRWPNATGDLYPMISRTLGPQQGHNSGPRVGPVVISEVHYNPPAGDEFEFVEILNPGKAPVDLTNWRIRKGIDYDFAAGTQLPARAVMVVVSFDPADGDQLAAFRAEYGIDDSVQIVGAYAGRLDDDGERVRLQRPDYPPLDEPDFIPRLLEDEVRYFDVSPWPWEAAGNGASLNRSETGSWGNDGGYWMPAFPSPGGTPLLDAASISGRWVFYDNSGFDGGYSGANVWDNAAIATDKQALLPGQTAGFVNYTSYSRGINGVMVDVEDLPEDAVLDGDDFEFHVGNNNAPDTWPAAPVPNSISMRSGPDDSDRVTVVWSDGAILNQWLRVKVLANADTGLDEPDVFYFGNAVGEAGNSAGDAKVNATDVLLARNNPRNFLNPAPINFAYDFNRDRRVNAADMLLARDNQTHFLDALKLITVPDAKRDSAHEAVFGQTGGEESKSREDAWGAMAWWYEFESERTKDVAEIADPQAAGMLADVRFTASQGG